MRILQLDDEASRPHLREIALKLRSSKRTVFVAGAGISCNAGIPDFRSKDGLYALVKREFPQNVVNGKDLFDTILFRDERTTEIFYSFMAGLRSATLQAEPTPTHRLLTLLKTKRKLLRVYTQNIDGLEEKAGLGANDTVQLHGDIHRLKCSHCLREFGWNAELAEEMHSGEAPECTECVSASLARQLSGKRAVSVGSLRPDIVLYGEEHPRGDEIAAQLKRDCARRPQLLIVAGTSLKVVGIKRLVKSLAQATRAAGGAVVFVNKSSVAKSEWDGVFDWHIMCDTDAWIGNVHSHIPSFFERQTRIKVEAAAPQTRKKAEPGTEIGENGEILSSLLPDPLAALPEPPSRSQPVSVLNAEPKLEPAVKVEAGYETQEPVPLNSSLQGSLQSSLQGSLDDSPETQFNNADAASASSSVANASPSASSSGASSGTVVNPTAPSESSSFVEPPMPLTPLTPRSRQNLSGRPPVSPAACNLIPAKRTKSDPYGETERQNDLLESPTKQDDFGSQETISEVPVLEF